MTTPRKRRTRPAHAWPAALALLLLAGGTPLLTLSASRPAQADAPINTIVALRPVTALRAPLTYDLTLTSTREFPMRDQSVTLQIGANQFTVSRYVPGGTLNTLVFSLTVAQARLLKSGQTVYVFYDQDDLQIPDARWDFGTVSASLLSGAGLTPSPIKPILPIKSAANAAGKTVTAPRAHKGAK